MLQKGLSFHRRLKNIKRKYKTLTELIYRSKNLRIVEALWSLHLSGFKNSLNVACRLPSSKANCYAAACNSFYKYGAHADVFKYLKIVRSAPLDSKKKKNLFATCTGLSICQISVSFDYLFNEDESIEVS